MSREADLYKDKIEVSLDGRQIFYLFFGGAVIVGLVFVLGVMVGRRVEARGHVDRARTTAAVDPLAALDRLEDKGGLSFKGSLMGGHDGVAKREDDVEHAIGVIEKQRKDPSKAAADKLKIEDKKIEAPKVADKPADKPKAEEKKLEPPKVADKPKAEDKKIEPPKVADKPKAEDKPTDKLTGDKPKNEDKKSEPKTEAKTEDKPKSEDKKSEDKKSEDKVKYTLQLSSFQDRAEADAFLATLKSQGFQASVTEASVSGKGTFYRVRMGSYRSIEAANDAKAEFEKKAQKSASVMKL
jgi:cell division protein FtsN